MLDPHALDTQADAAVRGLMREGSSANTAASYRAAIRYWTAWFELRYGQRFTLPLPEAAVIQFVVDHAQRSTDHGLKWELPLALDQELVRLKAKGKLGAPSLNTLLQACPCSPRRTSCSATPTLAVRPRSGNCWPRPAAPTPGAA